MRTKQMKASAMADAQKVHDLTARVAALEAEMLATLKWAKRMGYIDMQERLSKLLDRGGVRRP
jgi:hypothetical protein